MTNVISFPSPRADARQLGAYYTPPAITRFMARWAVRSGQEVVLEPSCGGGEFIDAVQGAARATAANAVQLWAVEISAKALDDALSRSQLVPEQGLLSDFFAISPFPVDVVIGNPPYVRLRHTDAAQSARALAIANTALGQLMEPSGSIWMPFVLHGCRFLKPGGRLALVLPYELTYVRYARPLWRYLGQHFGHLQLLRVYDRLFPDLLQEAVILLADDFGATTDQVEFAPLERFAASDHPDQATPARISLAAIATGQRLFTEALLPAKLRQLLQAITPQTTSLDQLARFNIGYVTGDKKFFHPNPKNVAGYQLPASSLRPALTSNRRLRKSGLFTSHASAATERLWLPATPPIHLTAGESAYLDHGIDQKVDQRFKCRNRQPWYVTPGVETPDVVIPVFSDQPLLLLNDANLAVSNSFLAGFLKRSTGPALLSSWYTSLTLLEAELRIHSLGGGVLVFIPGEVNQMQVFASEDLGQLSVINDLLQKGEIDAAYRVNNQALLSDRLHLTPADVALIEAGTDQLRRWRGHRSAPANDAELQAA